jgi:putative radical SAM enzyme (TIGR03279 family)
LNGKHPRDVIDFLEAAEESRIDLTLRRGDRVVRRTIRKESGRPLGLVFSEVVFDGVKTCRNRCLFCFIDQLPPGLRPSLYVRDDDYRLSFYHGNFVTLNNLSTEDLNRIIGLRLAPLYVSLHSTDAVLRSRLMGGNARAGLEALERLMGRGLELHLQVVVCPGLNDGAALRSTFRDVLTRYPAASLGVVPVGVAAGRASGPLRPHDRSSSLAVLELVEEFQGYSLERHGRRLFFAADEFYLLAGRDFPPAEEYEGYPQLENGVGMARKFIDEADGFPRRAAGYRGNRGIVTGEAGEKVLRRVLRDFCRGKEPEMAVVRNGLLGEGIWVSGLLAGRDIVESLRRRESGLTWLVPSSLLSGDRFLDGMTLEEAEKRTGATLVPVEVDGYRFLQELERGGG